MGKKYIPVEINGTAQKVYLDNVIQVHKYLLRKIRAAPAFSKIAIKQMGSLNTNADLSDRGEEFENFV
jgi:hypothetical protein